MVQDPGSEGPVLGCGLWDLRIQATLTGDSGGGDLRRLLEEVQEGSRWGPPGYPPWRGQIRWGPRGLAMPCTDSGSPLESPLEGRDPKP